MVTDKSQLESALAFASKPEYLSVLLSILRQNDYSMKIALDLSKAQSTIAEELKELNRTGLIESSTRRKAHKYRLNWEVLFSAIHEIIQKEFKDPIEESVLPQDFFRHYLEMYAAKVKKSNGIGKNLSEVVFSFYDTINALDQLGRQRLISTLTNKEGKRLSVFAKEFCARVNSIEIAALEAIIATPPKSGQTNEKRPISQTLKEA
jgi:hypothetical protein